MNSYRHLMTPNGLENGDLTPRQEAAALALASGYNLREASRRSKAGQRTIKTWTASKTAFARRITELRMEMTSLALGKLTSNLTSAADTLAHLSRKGKSEMVRLGAARALFELSTKLRESIEIEQRLAALEAASPNRFTS
jgi:hypothetical protein